MRYSDHDRVMALAGVFQAAHSVGQIAHRGMADSDDVQTSIYSLFQTEAESVPAIYGGERALATGMRCLLTQLTGKPARDMELTRYAVSLMQLERKLAANREMLRHVAAGIADTRQRLSHFALLHANILAGLADIYSNSISQLQPRIMVRGEALHLQNPDNANRIRALLLAGIRSAMLWRQTGGNRWQLLLGRKRLAQAASKLV